MFTNFNSFYFCKLRDGQSQGRLQAGIYTITPAMGIILQNGHQIITVECAPEAPGRFEEDLAIDITDRNMQEYPNGLSYRLTSEAAYPVLNNSIEMFEEHTIIPNILAFDPKLVCFMIHFFLIRRNCHYLMQFSTQFSE
jgi:hypothetical protein